MPRQVVGDDAVVLGDLVVLEEAAPLVVVTTRGVLADERLPPSVLEIEDLVEKSVDVDVDVVSGNWGDLPNIRSLGQ